MLRPLPERAAARVLDETPPAIGGKFFFVGDHKLYLRGVSYGPFATSAHGFPFPDERMLARDLALMAELGANTLRTFTVPPRWLLDRAAEHGLRVLVTIPWAEHVCFLDRKDLVAEIRGTVRAAAENCGNHPALFGFLVGNEIPPDIVRWYGPERVRDFLRVLRDEVKDRAPDALVSYANFPSTEYLDVTALVDFVSFNVYLHREADFRRYLSRLQNIAEDKPLVLTEFGIDSMREGQETQAEHLAWMIRAAFESGAAGTFVFSWTDDWFTGGAQIADWAFGLVDVARRPKPAYTAVQAQYAASLPPRLERSPRVSVVVCAYNADRTMDACLASLRTLNYPDYEVVVVNDGSTDRTLEIAERHKQAYDADPDGPRIVVIDQPNKGLSVARNVGAAAATGEIVAYTDSDCVPDPDWLAFLVYKFVRSGFVAVGGPNFPPPEPSLVPAAVAVSPGGPTHVLLNDEVAEHIPGCNMAFTKKALEEIHGFEPMYTAAGDDVDLCWRLQNRGYAIGFSPAATVWHYRRNTVKAYLKQQMGYGKAEALLYFKHPYRFNLLGQSRWLGRIYGELTSAVLSRRPIIYFGAFGRGLFQSMYEPPSSLLAYLPFTLEWNAIGVLLFLSALMTPSALPLAVLPLAVSVVWSIATAVRARIDPRFAGLRARALIAVLTYLGPLVRALQRYAWRLRGIGEIERIHMEGANQPARVDWLRRAFTTGYWSEHGHEKEALLGGIMEFLIPRKYLIAVDPGWNRWDLEVYRGVWSKARVTVAAENHGGPKRLLNVRCEVRLTRIAELALAGYLIAIVCGLLLHAPELTGVGLAVGIVNLAVVATENVRLGQILNDVFDIVAERIALRPVGAPASAKAA
ncbi:MAG TPA: glycosyltransferase [Candidatus Binatia bacterium]|nr:glycosyltransferase [Candidatus Binatia bacterium]